MATTKIINYIYTQYLTLSAIAFVCVAVYVVGVYMWEYVQRCVSMCKSQKSMLSTFLYHSTTRFLKTQSFIEPGAHSFC